MNRRSNMNEGFYLVGGEKIVFPFSYSHTLLSTFALRWFFKFFSSSLVCKALSDSCLEIENKHSNIIAKRARNLRKCMSDSFFTVAAVRYSGKTWNGISQAVVILFVNLDRWKWLNTFLLFPPKKVFFEPSNKVLRTALKVPCSLLWFQKSQFSWPPCLVKKPSHFIIFKRL